MDGGRGDTKQPLRFQTTAFQGCLYVIIHIYQYSIYIYIIKKIYVPPFLRNFQINQSKQNSPTLNRNPTHHHLRNSPSFPLGSGGSHGSSTLNRWQVRKPTNQAMSLRRSWGGRIVVRCQRAVFHHSHSTANGVKTAFRIIKCANKVVKVFPPAFRIQQGGSKY